MQAVPNLRLLVDVGVIRANLSLVRSHLAEGCRIIWAVKSNVYGMGLECVKPVEDLVSVLAVEDFFAAGRLLDVGATRPIMVLYPVSAESCPSGVISAVMSGKVMPTLDCVDLLEDWLRVRSGTDGAEFAVQLIVGGPGSRFGIERSQLAAVVERARREDVRIGGVYAHPTRSTSLPLGLLEEECALFSGAARDACPGVPLHFADSGCLLRGVGRDLDFVRTGLLPLGVPPVPFGDSWRKLKTAFSLRARVIRTREVRPDEQIGYSNAGGMRSTHLAIAAIGYAHGISRAVGLGGFVHWRGKRLDYAAEPWMETSPLWIAEEDLTILGDEVEVVGPNVSPEVLGGKTSRLPEEFFVRIRDTVHREYGPLEENH